MKNEMVEQFMRTIVDKIAKEDYGALPEDEVVNLRARVRDKVFEVYVVGKWRSICPYYHKRIPSAKVQAEAERRIRINTGHYYRPEQKFIFNFEEATDEKENN